MTLPIATRLYDGACHICLLRMPNYLFVVTIFLSRKLQFVTFAMTLFAEYSSKMPHHSPAMPGSSLPMMIIFPRAEGVLQDFGAQITILPILRDIRSLFSMMRIFTCAAARHAAWLRSFSCHARRTQRPDTPRIPPH